MNDDLLYKAIAELLNVDVRVMELINPEIGEDIGSSSDYFHYGYYCTFPQYDELDDEVKTELSKYIDIINAITSHSNKLMLSLTLLLIL